MKLKDRDSWAEYVNNNSSDPYSGAGVRFAERWANLMEEYMENGTPLKDCAKKASREANTEGITGFLYGCAVSILADVWEYGEELREWHNLDTQIGDEGEKANKEGKVLVPTIITVK